MKRSFLPIVAALFVCSYIDGFAANAGDAGGFASLPE